MRIVTACCVLALLAACGGGGSFFDPDVQGLFTIGDFEAAVVVVGQGQFNLAAANEGQPGPTATGLELPGAPVVAGGRMYLPDAGNNRILVYDGAVSATGAPADHVLGQAVFTSEGVGTTASQLNGPLALCSDGVRLFASDTNNNRVLVWSSLPAATGTAASFVLGQATFGANAAATTQGGMRLPFGLCVAAGKLLVCDTFNHRVLIWNALPATSGALPDLVLGQADFASGQANRAGPAAANTLSFPYGVWSDGTRVAVADGGNNRVLLWDAFPATNGQAAVRVLGQPDFAGVAPGTTQTSFRIPTDVTSTPAGQLVVADCENHRVLIWNGWPTASQETPVRIVGQNDYMKGAPNDTDQDGSSDPAPSARTLNASGGFLFARFFGDELYVGDHRNNRALVFED